MDRTLDPTLASWVPVRPGSEFPIQNLPYGAFTRPGEGPRIGVAIGDYVLDLPALHDAGHLDGILPDAVAHAPVLNPLMALDRETHTALRRRLSQLLDASGDRIGGDGDGFVAPQSQVTLLLPFDVADYVDFYSSVHHATNVGRLFRPGAEPLLPNWRHLPVGYHGRAGTVVVSGTPVTRPHGQRPGPDGPTFGPSARLDFELEVGFVTGRSSTPGVPVAAGDAEGHIFGLCLVNDWSARDIQAWEYVPLGPFLGKSFATTVSPWIVTLDALEPFRVDPPAQDPPPFPYLEAPARSAVDARLTVVIGDSVVTEVGLAQMYWTMAQQLAHATVNGASTRTGDLFASGTVSGPVPGSLGCLLEATANGAEPITLADGTTRTFLGDHDTVTLTARCEAPGAVPIGFGACTGTVLPADQLPDNALAAHATGGTP